MPDWIQDIDDRVLSFFLDHHAKVLNKSVLDATALGSTTLLALVVLFTLGVLLLHRQYRKAIVAAAVIWWQPGTPVTLAAFVLLGAALAGVFPALIGLTPDRIGRRRAQHVIAWQVGAAAVGGSALSALIGLLIGLVGLSVLGPSLTVLAVLLAGGIIVLERVAPMPAAEPVLDGGC